MEPINGIELLILSKLHRHEGPISTNEMQRELHLQKRSVLLALDSLTNQGLIKRTVVSKGEGGAIPGIKYYSLSSKIKLPKIESGAISALGLSIEPNFVRSWSLLELENVFPTSNTPPSTEIRKSIFPVFTRTQNRRINAELDKIEKEHWTRSKKSLDRLYYLAMDHFRQVLHLFLAELFSLDVLYRARFISSNDFKKSFVKLCQMYFGSHLSGELRGVIIGAFIQLAYPDANSTDLGLNLAREFRQHVSKPDSIGR